MRRSVPESRCWSGTSERLGRRRLVRCGPVVQLLQAVLRSHRLRLRLRLIRLLRVQRELRPPTRRLRLRLQRELRLRLQRQRELRLRLQRELLRPKTR